MSEESSGWRVVEASGGVEPDVACTYCCVQFSSTEIVEYISEGGEPLCPRCGIDSLMFAQGGMLPDIPELLRQRAAGFCIPEDEPIVPIIRINLRAIYESMDARAAGRVGEIDEETCRAALAELAGMFGEASDADAEGAAETGQDEETADAADSNDAGDAHE